MPESTQHPVIKNHILWQATIAGSIILVTYLHYSTSTHLWQYHLIFMQAYFIPIIIAAFQFGIRGGAGTAAIVSVLYLPHVMLQWGGLVEGNLMRFMQVVLFNVVGYVTGLNAQRAHNENQRYRQATKNLELSVNQLKEQSQKLAALEEQLRFADRLSVIGELTAGLAHEVRNPLGSIRGAVEILRNQLTEDKKHLEFFDILLTETDRLNRVLENYLGFARQKRTQVSHYDLMEELANFNLIMQPHARRHHVKFTITADDQSLEMLGNPQHLWQILMNLVLNAIKAVPEGGEVNIKINREFLQDGKLQLCVQDNGPGIAKEIMSDIFTPFFTTREDGTGLGLAIVRRLVDENRWQIRVESEMGVGTKFILDLAISNER